MSRADHRSPETPGHETRDVNVRGAMWFTVILSVAILASLGLMKLTFDQFAAAEDRQQSEPASSLTGTGPSQPPQPRLQMSPVQDLQAMRAEQEALLSSYAWVDREAGVARIPVERAMQLLVEAAPDRPRPVLPPIEEQEDTP